MRRYTSRLLVLVLAFSAGVSVYAGGLIPRFELFLVRLIFPVTQMTSRTAPTSLDDSNEVYTVILREKFLHHVQQPVVDPQITTYTPFENAAMRKQSGLDGSFSKTMHEFIPEVALETLVNYQAANSFGGPLTISAPGMNIEINSVNSIPGEDTKSFWSRFYQKYPNSSGIIYFSRVGFNNCLNQAMVYVTRTCHDACGSGGYVLLGKSNGKWHILHELAVP